jgi:hypothetical protein
LIDLFLENCDETTQVNWQQLAPGSKGYNIAANSKSEAIWVILPESYPSGNYVLAKFDPPTKKWLVDATQPIGVYSMVQWNYLAVDPTG